MAKEKAKLASSKPVSTKWLNNAMRSVGISTRNVIKKEFPNIYETAETGINTSKSVISTLRRNANGTNQISQQLQHNKYVKFAQSAYKNALNDLRSGNLNNESRVEKEMSSMFGGSGDENIESLFEDSGISFGDDGADNVNVNIVETSDNSNDAVFAVTTQMQKQTEATLKTSQANLNATIAMNSAAMMQHQQTNSLIVSGLDAINSNLTKLISFNNDNMNKFIEASMTFYEKMGAKIVSDGSASTTTQNAKLNGVDVINDTSGGINFSQYKQLVKQQFKDALSKSELGMVDGLLTDDMLKMAAANPLGFATEGLVKFMIPKVVTSTIKGVEETYSAFMPAFLHKLAGWGDEAASGILGKSKQFVGKMFGIKVDRADKIDTATSINKGPIPFDGQTKHAITEIITKELREQTSYLSIIANHFNKNGTASAKNNADVFDYKTGKYIKVSQITDNIMKEIQDSIVGTFNTTRFGKSVRGYKDNLTDPTQIESFNAGLDEFLAKLERAGVLKLNSDEFNNSESKYNKLLQSLSVSDDTRDIIHKAVQNTANTDPTALLDMTNAVLRAQTARNRKIDEISKNPYDYNLYAATDFNNKTLEQLEDEWYKNRPKNAATISSAVSTTATPQASILDKGKEALGGIFKKDDGITKKESTFERVLNNTTSSIKTFAVDLIHGSGSDAVNKFAKSMGAQFATLWSKFDSIILTPLKNNLLGTKDPETGFSKGGLFSGLTNGFKDAAGMLKHYITGKEYTDSTGKIHKKDSNTPSLFDNFKKIGTEIKEGVSEKFSGFKEYLKQGLQGWKDALFGKDDGTGKQHEQIKAKIVDTLKERLPDAATGGAIGAGVGIMAGGSLLGTLIGGPLGGAAIGTAVGFMAKSEKFQNFLFGEEDQDGNRVGGLISKDVQEYFKQNKKTAIGGAAVGAVTGGLTGGGVLGTLIGGPIAGALVGMGTSLLLKSDKFQTFLFGEMNAETGKRDLGGGFIDKLKSKLSSYGKDANGDPNNKNSVV
jgi:hypothetical protein